MDFLSASQLLMQKYLYESCDPGCDDYTNYMQLHNIVNSEAILALDIPTLRRFDDYL